jgi:hypothetical protein
MPRLPKAVEKQDELADQAYQQAYGTPEEATPPAPPVDQTAVEQTEPKPTEAVDSASQKESSEQLAGEKPAESSDLDYWKQRAKVAEGRLSKEMPRMAQTVRELRDQLAAAEQKSLSVNVEPVSEGVTPQEVETYGAEFIDMVKRAAKSAAGVDSDVKKQLEKISAAQQKTVRDAFFASLNRDAPNWERLNTDQGFLEYLAGLDPYTGRSRQELFDDAYEKLDAWRIANFFNAFESTGQPRGESPPPSRADQVVPSSSRAAQPESAKSKKIWTTEDVARFYDNVRRGKIAETEASRIESDIFAAQSEGRFR